MSVYPLLWWLLALLVGVAAITIALRLVHSGVRLSDLLGQGLAWIRHAPMLRRQHRGTELTAKSTPIRSNQDTPWAALTLFKGEEMLGVIKCPVDQVCERTIGRSTTLCDQVINDSAVSRCHVRVVWEPQGARWYVEDLGSKNGTRLNGLLLRAYSPAPLGQGDHLILGRLKLTIGIQYLGDPPESAA